MRLRIRNVYTTTNSFQKCFPKKIVFAGPMQVSDFARPIKALV